MTKFGFKFVRPESERRYPKSGNQIDVSPESLVARVWELKAKNDLRIKRQANEEKGIYELDLDL